MRASLLACMAVSTACVSTYVAPTGDVDTAVLSFDVEVTGKTLFGYGAYLMWRDSPDDHPYFIKPQIMAQIFKDNPLQDTNNPPRIVIPANAKIGLRAMFSAPTCFFCGDDGCNYDLSFSPEKDAVYRVKLDYAPGSCRVGLESAVNGSWHPMPVSVHSNYW